MRALFLTGLGLGLIACTHTEPFPIGVDPLGPLQTTELAQITFAASAEPSHQWTPDGRGVLYSYSDATVLGAARPSCFGIVPRLGGTRIWRYCDTRGENADSIVKYSPAALSAGGQLVFMEAIYKIPPPNLPLGAPTTVSIWVTDTADPPGHRRRVVKFPVVMGDSVISWGTQFGWLDENHFVFSGARYVTNSAGQETPEPRALVRGTITPAGASLEKIAGTDFGHLWTRATDGGMLFLRGHWWGFQTPDPRGSFRALLMDSVIFKLPLEGGAVQVVAQTSRRMGSFHCAVGECLATDLQESCTPTTCELTGPYTYRCIGSCSVTSNRFYFVDPSNWAFTLIPTVGLPYLFPTAPRLSPDGTEFAYLRSGFLNRAPFIHP